VTVRPRRGGKRCASPGGKAACSVVRRCRLTSRGPLVATNNEGATWCPGQPGILCDHQSSRERPARIYSLGGHQRRCQRSGVAAATSRCARSAFGNARAKGGKIVRAGHDNRGRPA
jgi:hypothetical protein